MPTQIFFRQRWNPKVSGRILEKSWILKLAVESYSLTGNPGISGRILQLATSISFNFPTGKFVELPDAPKIGKQFCLDIVSFRIRISCSFFFIVYFYYFYHYFYYFDTFLEDEYLADSLHLLCTSRAFSTRANSFSNLL